jgi:hypothetical protein
MPLSVYRNECAVIMIVSAHTQAASGGRMLSTAELRRQELAEDLGVMMVRARISHTHLCVQMFLHITSIWFLCRV